MLTNPQVVCVKVRVSGRVQGVGFRYWTADEARALGLVGYVRNLPDGGVEALFEGPAEIVQVMVEKMREGPALARVKNLVRDPAPEKSGYTEFFITK